MQSAPAAPGASPAPVPAAIAPPPPASPAGYVPQLCKDNDGNYTRDITEIPGFSCLLEPPQTVSVGPDDPRMVTCYHVAIQDKKTNRTLEECRAKFNDASTFVVPLADGQAECFEVTFYPDGKLKTCKQEHDTALLNVETLGMSLKCAEAEFDENEQLSLCRGDFQTEAEASFPTGYGVDVTCTLKGYRVVQLQDGHLRECWMSAAIEMETDQLMIACDGDRQVKLDENGYILPQFLKSCTRRLKSAIGPATETLVRDHPNPGPTDFKAMPICNRTSDQCSLKEPRWIALGPDGRKQVLCQGATFLHANPGYLLRCKTAQPPTFDTPNGPITCYEFEFRADGHLAFCGGVRYGDRDQLLPYEAVSVAGDRLLCALDDNQHDIAFWPGDVLGQCTPVEPAEITVKFGKVGCAAGEKVRFWPNGNLRSCTTTAPAKVAGPYGGDVTCQPGALRFLPDGGVSYCVFAEGESLPVELPGGKKVTCLREIEHYVSADRDSGKMISVALKTCDAFETPVTLQSGGESYDCVGAAWHPARKGGGLAGCVTQDNGRFEVNHEFQPACGRSDAVALMFDNNGSVKTVHQCKE
ncbi:hypothetical protein RXV86_14195 [Alisedimentitalea sp. MJ-SS2]|uniref:hypothetical protein n=1 Tax=Aliisedimentitalea sp. MJ-SS2 TaxID=3049795 RepID=UPI002914CABF|nr:hypothetical protein [Alisedimentitalea sp. MJ-SS2]MDU8928538.1 hypothetical protein [Alisedimentitalea sp. MJ-SS2]